MAGFGDIARRATDFFRSERTQKALKSEKAEEISDKVLDGVSGFANRVTGGKHKDKIDGARDAADKQLGRAIGPNADGTVRPDEPTADPSARDREDPTDGPRRP